MKQNIIVKKSNIEGRGVFANKDFKKGEIVLKWNTSNKLTKEEVDKLEKNEKKYVTFIDGVYTLIPKPERYVNHSCEPNTHVKNKCDVAIKDIKKGEEITGDYSEDLVLGEEMNCNCKSKNCRGIIKNE